MIAEWLVWASIHYLRCLTAGYLDSGIIKRYSTGRNTYFHGRSKLLKSYGEKDE